MKTDIPLNLVLLKLLRDSHAVSICYRAFVYYGNTHRSLQRGFANTLTFVVIAYAKRIGGTPF